MRRRAPRTRGPPFWLLMLAASCRRYVDFIAALRHAQRQGWSTPPHHQIIRAWAVRPLANSYALNRFMQADDPDFAQQEAERLLMSTPDLRSAIGLNLQILSTSLLIVRG